MQNSRRSHSAPKKDNEVFKSRYFANSQKKDSDVEIKHSFFMNHPFEKFYNDISKLKPILYKCPNERLLSRHYLVVEEKVTYGKPMNPEEFQKLISIKKSQPQIITWGNSQVKQQKNGMIDLPILSDNKRIKLEVQSKQKQFKFCSCCAGDTHQETYISQLKN